MDVTSDKIRYRVRVCVCACVRGCGTNLFETEYGPLAKFCEELKGNFVAVGYKKYFEFMKK
jgi:uncharacterized protein YqkB